MKAFSWSYSQLKNFETCGVRYFNYDVAKNIKEPESPALRDGHALHRAFEARLRGTPLPPSLGRFEPVLARVAAAGAADGNNLYVEQKLALSSGFTPVKFFADDAWFRTQVDAAVTTAAGVATLLDWKDGKVKTDTTQLKLMAAALFHTLSKIEVVHAALVFVNHNYVERETFVRADVTKIWANILPRVRVLEAARAANTFEPRPSGLCKNYCAVSSCPFMGIGR